MIEMPQKLEFGNMEHIKLAREAEKEAWILEHKDEIIKKHWKSHSFDCPTCDHPGHHDGDKAPKIELKKVDGKDTVLLTCDENWDCDFSVKFEVKLKAGFHQP